MIDELTGLLPQVTKLLVIGWRATEEHFLDLLRKHLNQESASTQWPGRKGEV